MVQICILYLNHFVKVKLINLVTTNFINIVEIINFILTSSNLLHFIKEPNMLLIISH